MHWINERCYKTLEDALMAYEEYKKNERILNGEGLVPLPRNLNFHNHYREVVPGVIEEISAYDMLGNKIATWGHAPQVNKVMTEKEFIRSGRGIPPEKGKVKRVDGEIYYTVDTNQIVIKSDDNLIKLASDKVYDLPNNHNCRNCGAPVRSCICEYCGTVY